MTNDWSFARRPFWIFSHLFALAVVVSFVFFGWWQLSRHYERADRNALIEERSTPPAASVIEALDEPADQLDFRFVTGPATYVDDEVVSVANRSQGGVAGRYVVGLAELPGGRLLLVNRGFVPLDEEAVEIEPAPTGLVEVEGWLRASVARGAFGAADTGQGDLVPRLDVDAIAERLGGADLAPVWLQLAPDPNQATATFPDPVPLPAVDGGPHISYMLQWFTFATLGVVFYGALLRRNARHDPRVERVAVTDG
ncbi:MAG: SURF1 family protein [Acidimicrobiales bacterium]